MAFGHFVIVHEYAYKTNVSDVLHCISVRIWSGQFKVDVMNFWRKTDLNSGAKYSHLPGRGFSTVADFRYPRLQWLVGITKGCSASPFSASVPLQLLLWPICLDLLSIVSYSGDQFWGIKDMWMHFLEGFYDVVYEHKRRRWIWMLEDGDMG